MMKKPQENEVKPVKGFEDWWKECTESLDDEGIGLSRKGYVQLAWNHQQQRIDELEKDQKELKDLRRWKSNLYQDECENAYVAVSLLDAHRQALTEVSPDHPILKGNPPSFGVWEAQRKEIESLYSENSALREKLERAENAEKALEWIFEHYMYRYFPPSKNTEYYILDNITDAVIAEEKTVLKTVLSAMAKEGQ